METLRQKQSRFARMVARLLSHIYEMGYEVTLGDAYRDPRVPYGHPTSLHRKRLAIDLNLFRDGHFLQATEDHRPIGEWWEAQGGAWGGRFNDGNHYSLEHEGMK